MAVNSFHDQIINFPWLNSYISLHYLFLYWILLSPIKCPPQTWSLYHYANWITPCNSCILKYLSYGANSHGVLYIYCYIYWWSVYLHFHWGNLISVLNWIWIIFLCLTPLSAIFQLLKLNNHKKALLHHFTCK